MMLQLTYIIDIMNTLAIKTKQSKVRTTLYLTQENKKRLDLIPRGKKTQLMNEAIADALRALEKEENSQKFIEMITEIEPVNSEHSSEEMVRMLRDGKIDQLLDNKNNNAK